MNMIYSRSPTRIFPGVHPEALRRQNPAKPPNLVRVQRRQVPRKRSQPIASASNSAMCLGRAFVKSLI